MIVNLDEIVEWDELLSLRGVTLNVEGDGEKWIRILEGTISVLGANVKVSKCELGFESYEVSDRGLLLNEVDSLSNFKLLDIFDKQKNSD